MLSPTETPFPIRAPRLAASMIPGPPPEMMANPRCANMVATLRVALYAHASFFVRALPKIVIAGPRSLSVSNPSTNSLMIRKTRHVSPGPNSSVFIVPPVCSWNAALSGGASSAAREGPEKARLHLLRQERFFHRREADDDPRHRAQGRVVEAVEVVEQQVLEFPPLDRHHHRALPGGLRD